MALYRRRTRGDVGEERRRVEPPKVVARRGQRRRGRGGQRRPGRGGLGPCLLVMGRGRPGPYILVLSRALGIVGPAGRVGFLGPSLRGSRGLLEVLPRPRVHLLWPNLRVGAGRGRQRFRLSWSGTGRQNDGQGICDRARFFLGGAVAEAVVSGGPNTEAEVVMVAGETILKIFGGEAKHPACTALPFARISRFRRVRSQAQAYLVYCRGPAEGSIAFRPLPILLRADSLFAEG